jgi:hypothetical protein
MAEQMIKRGRPDVQDAMDQLAVQIREEFSKPIPGVIAAPSRGLGYWTIGLLGVVVGVAALVGMPLLGRRPAPPPPLSESVTLYKVDACTQRQAAIVGAISAYTRDHGAAPDQLSDLAAGYLSEPAVDPESGAAYLYAHDGDTISLRCPNPELHAPPQPVNRPQSAAIDRPDAWAVGRAPLKRLWGAAR